MKMPTIMQRMDVNREIHSILSNFILGFICFYVKCFFFFLKNNIFDEIIF
jgi:hypothetical protein